MARNCRRQTWPVVAAVALLCAVSAKPQRLTAWGQLFVPPVVSCGLPRCDEDCATRDNKGLVCPRAATTIIALRGHMPDRDACFKLEDNGWKPERRPSAADPEGCGPCLLPREYDACHDSLNPLSHRGVRGGGGRGRREAGSVVWQSQSAGRPRVLSFMALVVTIRITPLTSHTWSEPIENTSRRGAKAHATAVKTTMVKSAACGRLMALCIYMLRPS